MEQTPSSRRPKAPTTAQANAANFAAWLRAQMEQRGYNLSLRGGGVTRLAEHSGVSKTVISGLLRGESHIPSPETLRLIASALRVNLGEVLIRAGVLTPAELRDIRDPNPTIGRPPITPEQAAAELGITDPTAVALFVANAQAAQQLQRLRPDDERAE